MPVVELTSDFKRRREVASIPGVRFDTVLGSWVMDTAVAGQYGRDLARQLFPEHAEELAREEPVTDFRPIDLATKWFDSLGTISYELLFPGVPEELCNLLYDYQITDTAYLVERLRQDGCGYFGWEPGLGKTLAALVAAWALDAHRIVCVVPNASKLAVWAREIPKWTKDRWTVFDLAGSQVQRDRVLSDWRAVDDGILLVHYEALRLVDWSFTTTKKGHVDLVICDEAHRLAKGGPGGRAPLFYKALKKIRADARLALSGSIVVNSPEDLFGALHWLAPTAYKSRWKDWNTRFIQYADGPWGKLMLGLRADKIDEMRHELASVLCVRRKVDELPGLPAKIEVTRFVELSASQRKVYDDLAERFFAELPDGEIILAPSVITQLGKLRQIATGLDLLGDEFADSSKLDLAVEMIEDNLPRKTVLFAWHRATVRAITARLLAKGISCTAVTGDTKAQDRATAIAAFQDDPDCKVIAATIKTLGESVTLHAASDLIFLESSWTPTDMQQAADRIHRIGQTAGRVTVTTIAAKDTVDEYKVLPTVKSKAEMRALVLGGGA